MEDLLQRAKKIQKQKKKNGSKAKGISFKQLLRFINRELPKSEFNALELTRSTFIDEMGDSAIQDLRNLIELAKLASREQDLPMADLFYELKELKEQEIALIYNYIKQK